MLKLGTASELGLVVGVGVGSLDTRDTGIVVGVTDTTFTAVFCVDTKTVYTIPATIIKATMTVPRITGKRDGFGDGMSGPIFGFIGISIMARISQKHLL